MLSTFFFLLDLCFKNWVKPIELGIGWDIDYKLLNKWKSTEPIKTGHRFRDVNGAGRSGDGGYILITISAIESIPHPHFGSPLRGILSPVPVPANLRGSPRIPTVHAEIYKHDFLYILF